MHNYIVPKLCAFNVFSPPISNVATRINFTNTELHIDKYMFTNPVVCKRIVKSTKYFKLENNSIRPQNSTTGLKKDFKNLYRSYLAAKGNHLTANSTKQIAQTNANSSLPASNSYRHSNITTQQQLHQIYDTLFFNRVLDHTGRLYIKTSGKDQSKKSNP